MPSLFTTVDDLVSEVRSQLDELNRDSVDTTLDILPALNRAQDFAADILARFYPEPLVKSASVSLVTGVQEYDIPEDCFEDRLQKVEVFVGQQYVEVDRMSYRDITAYESPNANIIPRYYAVVGRKYRLVPQPTASYPLRIWYIRNPDKLALSQGRITVLNSASNYLVVDEPGTDLTTETDQLGSYFNVVDGQTGEIKRTLQIQNIADNRITTRVVPTRSTVLGRDISTEINPTGATTTVAVDDYLAPIQGTSVLYFDRPTRNFLIQYAVSEIARSRGGEAAAEEAILDKFEKQIQRTWVGREQQLRVKKRSHAWTAPIRRWFRQ